MNSVDVLVVGLGPAGAAAAQAAARAGVTGMAVDRRARAGEPVQCAEFVPGPLRQHVRALEFVVRQSIHRMVTRIERQAPDETPDFRGCMIDRAAFDARLVDDARSAGAECRFGVALRRIDRDGAVVLSTGEAIRARTIIGADGPRSVVGKAIGCGNRELVETRQIRVRLKRPHNATDIFLTADLPGGYGWLFPTGAEANLGVGVAPTERARLKPALARLHDQLVADGRIESAVLGHTGGLIPVGGMVGPVGRVGSTNVLLAGDAAGLANPVTGAGIAAAVQSGHLAGRASAALDEAAAYREELDELFGASLRRACARRAELLAVHASGRPDAAALRRGWIAYREYWAA
jgi:digeranylgeranylglycerophospholipid reductase